MNAPASTLEHYWMPFTDNRRFKQAPRMVVSAQDMHYTTAEGTQVLDGLSTLWCVNAGHCRPKIVEAIRRQAGVLDFSSSFSIGHPLPFQVAERIARLTPEGLNHVFFTNSGSESVDTALKIALAYHRLNGQPTRTRFIGRERGYHGVNLAGISVGGVPATRKAYAGALMAGVDHLRHTQDLKSRAFVRGLAPTGAELADELEERLIPLHGAENIAAVIVEPVAGAGGVLIPPKGYLERLRAITEKHGILLIFDEVITAFGRLGGAFSADVYGVVPDMITFAKGVTSGTVPMGGVVVANPIHDAFMVGPPGAIEIFHGYTYSAHVLACAAGVATLQLYRDEDLFARARKMAPVFEEALHSLKGARHVIDIRSGGLVGAVELEPRPGAPGARTYDTFLGCWEKGLLVRQAGENICFAPALIVEESHIAEMVGTLRDVLARVD